MKILTLMKAIGDIDDRYIEEAQESVLEPDTQDISKRKNKNNNIKFFGSILAVAAAFALFIVSKDMIFNNVTDDDYVQVVNPMTEYVSLDEASAYVGFDITIPDCIQGFEITGYTVYDGVMLQAEYGNDDNTIVYVRKQAGTEDISGDYNTYEDVEILNINGKEITAKGNGNLIYVATWSKDGYTYAVSFEDGISMEELKTVVDSIR